MLQNTAVVLDRQPGQRDEIRKRLSYCGVLPICFEDEWICLENVHHIKPGFAMLRTGSYERTLRFVNIARAIRSDFPIVVLSDKENIEGLIRNNWLANLFFLRYPVDAKEFQATIDTLAKLRKKSDTPVLIAASLERKRLMMELPLLGLAREPILIQGQRGVGKKEIARAIHGFSLTKAAGLDFIDARDVTGQWIRETGARIKAANRGAGISKIQIIKHLEKLSYSHQSQLLLVLDEIDSNRERNRVFSAAPFMALAEENLESLVQSGVFRKDLYHRLSVLKISVPPLAGHSDDIHAIAEYFAARYGIRKIGSICRLTNTVLNEFFAYHWPGNISELKQAVATVVSKYEEEQSADALDGCYCGFQRQDNQTVNAWIDADDLRKYIAESSELSLKKARTRYVALVEKRLMRVALKQTNGNCKRAAGLLNISYKSMLNKAKEYHLV